MLGAILKREPGFEVVGEAEDATSAIELALRRRPDVVLLDVDMPGGGGARAAVEIREGLPERADRRDQRRRLAELSVRHDARGRGGLRHQGLAGRRDPARDPLARPLVVGTADRARPRPGELPLLDGRERREVARDARASAITDLTLTAAGRPRQATFLLAAVDDDRHVGIVFVVARELRVELVARGSGTTQ